MNKEYYVIDHDYMVKYKTTEIVSAVRTLFFFRDNLPKRRYKLLMLRNQNYTTLLHFDEAIPKDVIEHILEGAQA